MGPSCALLIMTGLLHNYKKPTAASLIYVKFARLRWPVSTYVRTVTSLLGDSVTASSFHLQLSALSLARWPHFLWPFSIPTDTEKSTFKEIVLSRVRRPLTVMSIHAYAKIQLHMNSNSLRLCAWSSHKWQCLQQWFQGYECSHFQLAETSLNNIGIPRRRWRGVVRSQSSRSTVYSKPGT